MGKLVLILVFMLIIIIAIIFKLMGISYSGSGQITQDQKLVLEKILQKENDEISEPDVNIPAWMAKMIADAPSKESIISNKRDEFTKYEELISDIVADPSKRTNLLDPLSGNIDYLMSDDTIENHIRSKLTEWRKAGVLVTEDEFAKKDMSKYHLQLSKHIEPQNTYADVTRLFGAEYLKNIFTKDNVIDKVDVPSYKLVVKNLSDIKVFIVNKRLDRYDNGLLWRAIDGKLYADKIIGDPSIKRIDALVKKVVKINPSNQSWIRSDDYPKNDYIQSIANSRFSDYGVGIGANALGDNTIQSNGIDYFIDTELKSFIPKSKVTDFTEYLADRFNVQHGFPLGGESTVSFVIKL
jgi:hypothetical protein